MQNRFEIPWLEAAKAITQRKKKVKQAIAESGYRFGNPNALSDLVIDAFHSEMHYGPDIHAVAALNEAWTDIIFSKDQEKYIRHNKKQPEDLQLVAN